MGHICKKLWKNYCNSNYTSSITKLKKRLLIDLKYNHMFC